MAGRPIIPAEIKPVRILLIAPPYALEEYPLPPLSLSYLSGSLLAHGFEVEILDLLTSKASAAKIRRKLQQYQPQLVGTTCVTMTFPAAARILRVCKEFDPGITTVMGGQHVSFAAEDAFHRAPWIDVVVAGEGDVTVVELASALDKGTDIGKVAGLYLNRNGKAIRTAPRPLIGNLDELPVPARHLLPLSKYHALGAACSVVSSRGCPYGCIFCTTPRMYGRKVRFRQPHLVVDEIEAVHREYGFNQINMVDDTFTLNRPHATELCRELIRRRLPVTWSIFSRVDTLTPELLNLMREAGCTCMLFGVESGNEEVLRNIKKGITPDKVRNGVKLATEAGIGSFASFILGLPGETPERARETLTFAMELSERWGTQYGFHYLSPFPGTELFEQAKELGIRILSRNWARYNANEVITEASEGGMAAVKEVMARYDEGIAMAWETIRGQAEAGDADSIQKLSNGQTGGFVWKLLREDAIERLGRVRGAATPQEAETKLVEVLAQNLSTPLEVAGQEVRRLSQNRWLQPQPLSNGFVWHWA
jgi:anaerobic magnesium-protoporphyrin IX monomethyl ester cyclase